MLLSLLMVPAFSQEETRKVSTEQTDIPIRTVFNSGNKKVSHGGYGALTFGVDFKGPQTMLSYGIKSGWLINHHIALGVAGRGFVGLDKYVFEDAPFEEYRVTGGYGGLLIEPVIAPFLPVHISFPIIIGAGGIGYADVDDWDDNDWDDDDPYNDDYDNYAYDKAAFFVIEPGVEMEINLLKFMRLGVGVSYRYTSDIQMVKTEKDLMRGFSGTVAVKFGKF